MWVLLPRPPRPDATYWPGRRWLASADAVAWPLLWVLVFQHALVPVGIEVPTVVALAVICAGRRLYRALWVNHRYRFTTWRWGGVVIALLLMGVVLTLAMPR